jgi:ribosomal protein S18 acetylase RimI-like enzyme
MDKGFYHNVTYSCLTSEPGWNGLEENNISIRVYDERDNEYVTKLMQDLCVTYNTDFDEDRWRRSLEQKKANSALTRMFVADLDDNVIGMLVADIRHTQEDKVGYITNLIVSPDFRNKGVGERLISSAIDFFRDSHVSTIKANIRPKTSLAMKLLAKLGFEETVVQLRKDL